MRRSVPQVASSAAIAAASILLALATPVLSVFSRGVAATVLVAVVALLCLAARGEPGAGRAWRDLGVALGSFGGAAVFALVIFTALSVLWSPTPARGALHAFHFAGSVALAAIGAALAFRLAPAMGRWSPAIAVACAATILLVELHTEGAVRAGVGLRVDFFRLNRAAVAVALLLPVAVGLLVLARRPLTAAVLAVLAGTAIMVSVSNSAKLGFLIACLLAPFVIAMPRLATRVVGGAAAVVILAMPVLAPLANDLVPDALHARSGYASLTQRGDIWRETAPFVWQKPIFGWGVEAGNVLAHLPETAGKSEEQRVLLDMGHPHNAPLQIWLELGAVGALLAAAAVWAGFKALERLPQGLAPYATLSAGAAFAVACVSHGAWQAWWWGLLGLVSVAFAAAAAHSGGRERRAR